MDLAAAEVENLMKVRARQFHFIDRVNHNLGFVTLLSYVADTAAAAGMLTVLITNEEQSSVSFPAKLLGTIVFVTYATVLYIPMVLATEAVCSAKRKFKMQRSPVTPHNPGRLDFSFFRRKKQICFCIKLPSRLTV
jgi:hypothetical protein